ncbi:MAG: DUF4405 domain-containing protein [Verrucomicrobiales bacterium]
MNRGLLNLIIDLLAAVCLLAMVATGYVLRFPLPPTTNRTHELWSFSRHEWGVLHSWASLALLVVLLVHVLVHWKWIVAMVCRRFSHDKGSTPTRPLSAGLMTAAALIALVGLWAAATHLGVREREVPLHPLDKPGETKESRSNSAEVSAVPLSSPPPESQAPDFWKDVMPVFEISCVACHGPEQQHAGFRIDRREDFFSAKSGKPLVVPGDTESSRLLDIVSGKIKTRKAAAAHRLLPEEIALLEAWIVAGADWPVNGLPEEGAEQAEGRP